MSIKHFIRAGACSFVVIAFSFLSGAAAFSYYGVPVTPEDELGLSSGYHSQRNVYTPNPYLNRNNSPSRPRVNYYAGEAPGAPAKTKSDKITVREFQKIIRGLIKQGAAKEKVSLDKIISDLKGVPQGAWIYEEDVDNAKILLRDLHNDKHMGKELVNFADLGLSEPWYQDNPYCVAAISGFSQFNDNTFVWAPPTMEEHIRAFFKLKCSDAALQRLCEAQFITNYNVLHYKVFCSRLMKIQGQAKGKDATALITAYAKELEAKGPKVFQEREAWRGEPFDVASCKTGVEYMQKRFTDLKWDFDPQILKDTNLARFERAETTGQDSTLERCLGTVRNQNSLLKTSNRKYDMNMSLQNLTHWFKSSKCQIPSSRYIWRKS
ncbi:MAG: hypothetical protein J6E31_02085 [Pyramidobacter sp.]|nr:hypothetical protein [Pyramidobacter sp.]